MVKCIMRNEFTPKEKDMAEFVAMLTGKTVYFDNQKNKYILASKDKINQLVKISYNNNDYIKANELLESANKVFSTDIKNVFRSVVSKSMRLKTSVFLSLLNQANNSAVSISDVMRKKIILYLKDELEKLDITDENKSLLKQSLSVWDNRKSVKHKDNYLDSFFICDILSSERSIEIIREIPHYSVIDGGELENAITVYAKAIFKSYLKNLDFSNDQINHVLSFYGNASIVPDDVFFSITESEKKNTDLLLVADIDIRHYFHNILQMKESFPIKSKTKRGFDLKEMKVLNNFIKTFSVLDSDSEDNTDESVFDESFPLRIGMTFDVSLNEIPHIVIEDAKTREFQYIEVNKIAELETIILKELFHVDLSDETSLRKKRDEYTAVKDYKRAQDMNNQLYYIDSCKKISKFFVKSLCFYISSSKVISITIPKGLLLWFNALGGDKIIPELVKK